MRLFSGFSGNFRTKGVKVTDKKEIVIAVETTGLNPEYDEILRAVIADFTGKILFDSYFRPHCMSWKEAQEVNHITPEMVKFEPDFNDFVQKIEKILENAEKIIFYNSDFCVEFLEKNGVVMPCNTPVADVMGEFADRYNDGYFKTLSECAEFCGYSYRNSYYDTAEKCHAVLHCYKFMAH